MRYKASDRRSATTRSASLRQRQDRRLALNPRLTFCEDPVRDEATVGRLLIADEIAGQLPRRDMFGTCERGPGLVDSPLPRPSARCSSGWRGRDSGGHALRAVRGQLDSGEIPVHHGMAIPVKVEPLLSDISGTQHKWPEGRGECGTRRHPGADLLADQSR